MAGVDDGVAPPGHVSEERGVDVGDEGGDLRDKG